jgi:hypothetical protein
MIDLGISLEHYNFLMGLCGLLVGIVLNLAVILMIHKL